MPELETRHAGLLAELPDVDSLIHACEAVRDAGYTAFDAHTPYPVHGIDDAIGISSMLSLTNGTLPSA